MVTAMGAYVRKEEVPTGNGDVETVEIPRQRHFNAVVQLKSKAITANTIDVTRHMILQRIVAEGQVPLEDVRDIVFLNWSHLGFMTEEEFQDVSDDEEETPKKGKRNKRPVSSSEAIYS
jgi:hypothetical protein